MIVDTTPEATIFDELIRFNPWAQPHWRERNELIRSERWNVNHLNQGGNTVTSRWLSEFHAARSQATLRRLSGDPAVFQDWIAGVSRIVGRLLNDEDFSNAYAGTPMTEATGGWSINRSEIIKGYSIGQFKADVLHLTQPSLRDLAIHEELDISGRDFAFGLDLANTTFPAPLIARNACFGPYSNFSAKVFDNADFSGSHFLSGGDFTLTCFEKAVSFVKARFGGPATFQGARFSGAADFSGAQFDDAAEFHGVFFETTPDFSLAIFKGITSFEDAAFKASAIFTNTRFPGRVYVGHISEDIRTMIVNADHAKLD